MGTSKTKRRWLALLVWVTAACVLLTIAAWNRADRAGAAANTPDPAASWAFTEDSLAEGSTQAFADAMGGSYGNLSAVGGNPAFAEVSGHEGKVMSPAPAVNNKWGDMTCPWYLDIANKAYTLSMKINIPAGVAGYGGVLFSDLVVLDRQTGATTFTWCLWVKGDGTIELMGFNKTEGWGPGLKWYHNLGTASIGAWTEVTLVLNLPRASIQSYLDGKLEKDMKLDSTIKTNIVNLVSEQHPYDAAKKNIGFQVGNNGEQNMPFAGSYANLKIYEKALTQAELDPDYVAPTVSPSGSPDPSERPELPNDPAGFLGAPIGAWDFTNADDAANRGKVVKTVADVSGGSQILMAPISTKWMEDAKFSKAVKAGNYYYGMNGAYDLNDGFTIAAWVRSDELYEGTYLMSDVTYELFADAQGKHNDRLTQNWDIKVDDKKRLVFEVADGAIQSFPITGPMSTDALAEGEWVHIAVSFDRAGGYLYGYVNGALRNAAVSHIPSELVDTAAYGGICIGTPAKNLLGTTVENLHFPGQIARVRIYDTNMGAANIAKVMNGEDNAPGAAEQETAGEFPSDSLLAGAWNADEGEGELIHDVSGKNNHAILGTGVSWGMDLSSEGKYDSVVLPGYAVTAAALDLSKSSTIMLDVSIQPTNAGFSTMLSSRTTHRYHELGYLDKDFYIDSNPAYWNIHVHPNGKICFDCQGAWNLNLIQVPYVLTPPDAKSSGWARFAVTITQPAAEGENYVFRFYLDGNLTFIAERPEGIGAPEAGDGTVFFANMDAANNLVGGAAEYRFYTAALTQAQLRKLANGDGKATPDTLGLKQVKDFAPAASYEKGKEISIDLKEYFTDDAWPALTFQVYSKGDKETAVGVVTDGVWKYTPTEAADKLEIVIGAYAGIQGLEIPVTLKVVEGSGGDTQSPSPEPGTESGGCSCGTIAPMFGGGWGLLAVGILPIAVVLCCKRRLRRQKR